MAMDESLFDFMTARIHLPIHFTPLGLAVRVLRNERGEILLL